MTKIPFGELMLTVTQVNKMGKTLWNDPVDDESIEAWTKLSKRSRENFIRDFILTIPKVLGTIGLKAVKK